jgi:TRAP transporter TAXI family solute receptor
MRISAIPGLFRRRETSYLVVALALALAGLLFVYLTSPTRLTVVVGPPGSADETLMHAFATQLGQQKTGIKLKVRTVPDVREAAQELERNRADLAIVRSDVAIPPNGLTMAVLREAAVIIVAPHSAKLEDLPALDGKKLGIVLSHEADPHLIEMLLRHYDLDASAVTLLPLSADRIGPALNAGEIDAVALVAPAAGTRAAELVKNLVKAYNGQLAFIGIEEADAISQRQPYLSAVTIPSGAWGGRPKQPPEEVKTAGVTYRLMARSDVDRTAISVTTQYLFQMRSRLAVVTRAANFMKAPENDTSTSAMLPNHPGAVDYFQREQESFMDRYGDWVYLVAFFGSGLLSALAWVRQRFLRERREEIDDVLDRLLIILAEARMAGTQARLDELSVEIDRLLAVAVGHARTGTASDRTTSAVVLALDGARSAIADRRREVAGGAEPNRREDPPRLLKVT